MVLKNELPPIIRVCAPFYGVVLKYDAQSSPVVLILIPRSKATSRIYHHMLLFDNFLLFVSWQIASDEQETFETWFKRSQKTEEKPIKSRKN